MLFFIRRQMGGVMEANDCGDERQGLVWVLFGFLNRRCALTPTMARSKPNQNRVPAGRLKHGVATKTTLHLFEQASGAGIAAFLYSL